MKNRIIGVIVIFVFSVTAVFRNIKLQTVFLAVAVHQFLMQATILTARLVSHLLVNL